MKKIIILLTAILFISTTLSAITVDGNAYLENQTNHDSIKVLFERTAPSSLTDSTYTDSDGYYSIDIETGFYDITYSKDGYNSEFLYNQSIFADITLPDVTLLEHQTLLNVPSDFSTIQSAIDYAWTADTVLVQPGTYVENINFNGKNITVASLYLTTQDTSYISQTVIDGNQNGSVVKFENGEDNFAVLYGFTISNGYTYGSGGGICCYYNSSPSLVNVTISGNTASSGGGICCSSSSPSLTNVTITGNSTSDRGGGIYCGSSSPILANVTISGNMASSGGGIYCSSSSPSLNNVTISGNTATGSGYYRGGGGISCYSNSSPSFVNVTINGNTSYNDGGGIRCKSSNPSLNNVTISGNSASSSGGGIYCRSSSPILANVTISGNTASSGGGIYCCYSSSPSLENVIITGNTTNYYCGGGICCVDSSPSLTYVTISGNSASSDGGGIYCGSSSPILANVTISGNSASSSGGGICCGDSSPSLVNCIVSDNTGDYGIYVYSGSPSITFSDFYSNENGNFYNCGTGVGVNVITNANGDSCDVYYNIQMNPCFVDTTNGDYHLQSNSPCIDAGDPNYPLDPDGTIADMGAFYFDHNCPIADFTSDVTMGNIPLIVNFTDLSQESSFGVPIISWLWDFGDSITSTEQNPFHEFLSGGYYTISLTVTDSADYSNTEIKQDYIHAISVEIQNLDIGGDEDLQHLITHTPLITFEFYNAGGLTQTHYQIQVSSFADFSTIDMWDTGEVESDTTSVLYAGNTLVDGMTYYLRARVASGDSWSDWATLQFRMNSLPSIPVLLSPINDVIVNVANPYLWIENSFDAEMDTLTYDFELATDVTFNNILFSQSNVTEGIDSTSCQVTATLTDNQQYWWRAKTYDGYEYCNYSNPESFILNAENEPPGEFELLTPENGTEVTTLSPILDWEDAIDPDPLDEVSYTILIGDEIPNLISIDAGNESVYQLTTPLEDNTLYYWKVIATDLYGASTENTGGFHTFIVNTENNAPNSFDLITPTEYSVEIDLTPIFYWENAGDPDIGDTLTYFLYYDMDSLFITTVPVETDSNHYIPTEPLYDNSTYFWKVIAVDEAGFRASIESETWLFWTNTELEPPNPFDLLSPENGEEGLPTTPEFVWNIATDNDPNDYAVYNLLISEDSTFTQVDYFSEGLIDTFFIMSDELTDSTRYFWRIDAVDTDSLVTSSEVWSFTVGNIAIDEILITPSEYILYQNSPNPFYNITHISYSLPYPSKVKIQIYNIKGQIVETLLNEEKPAGYHSVEWNSKGMSSGIYFYKLSTKDKTFIKKMIFLR